MRRTDVDADDVARSEREFRVRLRILISGQEKAAAKCTAKEKGV